MKVELLPEPKRKGPAWGERCTAIHSQAHTHEELIRHPHRQLCKHGAVVKVDGKSLCRIHAGFRLLEFAVASGELYSLETLRLAKRASHAQGVHDQRSRDFNSRNGHDMGQ